MSNPVIYLCDVPTEKIVQALRVEQLSSAIDLNDLQAIAPQLLKASAEVAGGKLVRITLEA